MPLTRAGPAVRPRAALCGSVVGRRNPIWASTPRTRPPSPKIRIDEQLLEGIGVTEADAKAHLPLASTIGAASALGAFCRSSFEEGLGSFGLGLELQVPGRPNGAAVIYEGLRRAGVPERALEFYRIHVEAEEEHGDNAERALAPYVQTPQQQALVRHAFRWTVVALSGMQRGFDAYLA